MLQAYFRLTCFISAQGIAFVQEARPWHNAHTSSRERADMASLVQQSPKKNAEEIEVSNGEAATPTVPDTVQEGKVCFECLVEYFCEDEYYFIRKGYPQIICKNCSRVKRRIAEIRKGGLQMSSFGELSKKERAEFMVANANTFKEDLKKNLMETCKVQNSKSLRTAFKEIGDPMLEGNAKKLAKYAHVEGDGSPEEERWNKLLQNAHRYTCDVDGSKYIVVPRYEFTKEAVNEDKQIRGRELWQESTVKGVKAEKKGKAAKGEKPRPKLTDAMIKKVDSAVASCSGCVLQLKAACMSSSKDAQPFVPEHLVTLTKDLGKEITDKLGELKQLKADGDKAALATALKEQADVCGRAAELLTTLEGCWRSWGVQPIISLSRMT